MVIEGRESKTHKYFVLFFLPFCGVFSDKYSFSNIPPILVLKRHFSVVNFETVIGF